ncbi:PTR2-domain-containing protein [Dothidotthia symphoricarpi CBS 119687]|uniref:PTR2-domain-containing protein n=1 Tax=Dothidotthia symphoricarpi CBS 119687 TaxID=1392245 RepID=A0A6A6ADX9_9PLEO|nr:PTR2-domain-containing protein [Dothidotthia symphoricarpi CBS 119687]KAF2129483.1 PTR2-domain-containing protein [Dothidotthia symphoricarpi CBS 119687]
MSSGAALEVADAAAANYPAIQKGLQDQTISEKQHSLTSTDLMGPNGDEYPSEADWATLRRVYGRVNWMIYIIGIIEMCERFAYYGTTIVFVNFIQQDLPTSGPFPAAGAAGTNGQAGALGMGQRASTGLVQFNAFFSYIMPMVGGWLADEYWGKFKTIYLAIVLATSGHIFLIIAAIPAVIAMPKGALGLFIVGLILFGSGVGLFKCCISPLIAEQYEHENPRALIRVEPSGERVIVDPGITISRIYMRYYLLINIGALVGQISMVYAEKYVGFWLSFTLPTILFVFCPLLMVLFSKHYVKKPPQGDVLVKSVKLYALVLKGRWSLNPVRTWRNLEDANKWEKVRPSTMTNKPKWMTFNDAWVDEVRRGFKACYVFLWLPIFWLPYGQMTSNLTSQAATMQLNGVPNDVVQNLNPFTLLIFIPIFDKFFYPWLARIGINFTPLKKIQAGFACAMLSMVVAAVVQHFIYAKSPCGKGASSCDETPNLDVWVQTPAYILIAFSEIFASITGLEYAYTKAPKNMRSLVTGVFWFTHAFSSAIAQAFVPLAADPLLVWLYVTIAILTFIGWVGFWWTFRDLDKENDSLDKLPEGGFQSDFERAAATKEPVEKV